MMKPYVWWIIVAAVLIGHFGLNLAIYNRLNAVGLRRRTVKLWVKLFFVFTIGLPLVVLYFQWDLVVDVLQGRPQSLPIPIALQIYSWLCLTSWVWLGLPWLLWRPRFGLEWMPVQRDCEVVAVDDHVDSSLALTRSCKLQSRFPGNQIFELAVESIELPVVHLPKQLDGYRVAHLSDIHLTGDVHPDFTRYVVERATQWQPDLMALTGDIIDKQHCIDWLEEIFSPAAARDGCYYVLGNHDTRVVDSTQTRDAMDRAGWTDLGGRAVNCRLANVDATLIGNEHPWFPRPDLSPDAEGRLRLLLSHSPDQIRWARRHGITLMLAGHTHGGQGRLPMLGPLLSPSFHGSRYASGDFFISPTTMHVSRGLSGTHLLRVNCRPELSLLTLRAR